MPPDPFDLAKIRRNWQMAGGAEGTRLGGRLASVPAPRDPFAAARVDLARVRELIASDFASHGSILAPFVRRIEDTIARLEASAQAGDPTADTRPLRAELQQSLTDLEDLLEVFSMLPP